DEADAQLGNRSSSGDSGVGNRVFAQIAQFMGNTELRGKVLWFLLTSRPDLLPVDLKRQGRAEEHIALFYPDSDAERLAMWHAMGKKTGVQISSPEIDKFIQERGGTLSGADIEAVLVRARMRRAMENDGQIGIDDLNLEDAAVAADILQKLAQTIAFCVGGWWVYMNYVRGRTHVPRLQLELNAAVNQKDGRFYVLATVERSRIPAYRMCKSRN